MANTGSRWSRLRPSETGLRRILRAAGSIWLTCGTGAGMGVRLCVSWRHLSVSVHTSGFCAIAFRAVRECCHSESTLVADVNATHCKHSKGALFKNGPKAKRAFISVAVAQCAGRRCAQALDYADTALKANGDFVLAAVAQHVDAPKYAAAPPWSDRSFVRSAVPRDGNALTKASPALTSDRDVVLTTVADGVRSFMDF